MRFTICALLTAALAAPLPALERAALVIGNDSYTTLPLLNAVGDAEAVRDMLVQQLGFPQQSVIFGKNLSRTAIYEKLEAFGKVAEGASVALIYYAGHGMESMDGRENFLLPVEADVTSLITSEARLRAAGVNVEELLTQASQSTPHGAKVVLLDCCRERPTGRGTARAGGGLAIYADDRIPADTLVLLAAAPSRQASDGAGRGPFTAAVLEVLPRGGASILESFFAVSDRVLSTTQKQQVPWIKFDGSGRIFRESYFLKAPVPGIAAPPGRAVNGNSHANTPPGRTVPPATPTSTVSNTSGQSAAWRFRVEKIFPSATSVAFNADRSTVVLGGTEALVLDAETLAQRGAALHHPNPKGVFTAEYSADGRQIYLHDGYSLSVWSASNFQHTGVVVKGRIRKGSSFYFNNETGYFAYSISPKSDMVAAYAGYWVDVWSTKSGKRIGGTIPSDSGVWDVTWSPDSSALLIWDANRDTQVIDPANGAAIRKKIQNVDEPPVPCLNGSSPKIVLSEVDYDAKKSWFQLWDAKLTTRIGKKMEQQAGEFGFTHDGAEIVAAGYDEIAVWRVSDQTQLWSKRLPRRLIPESVNVSPDSRKVCILARDSDPDEYFVFVHTVADGFLEGIYKQPDKITMAKFGKTDATVFVVDHQGVTVWKDAAN